MPPLPTLSGRQVVRVFETLGWNVARRRGSHIVMVKDEHIATLSVPDHKEVAKGTIRSLIRSSGITVKRFEDALRNV